MRASLVTFDTLPLLTSVIYSPAHGQGWRWQGEPTAILYLPHLERKVAALIPGRHVAGRAGRMESICQGTERWS